MPHFHLGTSERRRDNVKRTTSCTITAALLVRTQHVSLIVELEARHTCLPQAVCWNVHVCSFWCTLLSDVDM